jgi:2-phospho-L-lactate/phosphoenolpyruvate guanylyltransferase
MRTSLDPIHAVVPLRSVAGGKARLGEALDAEEREVLILGMLERTLEVLGTWTPCTRIHVVTQDLLVARRVASHTVGAILQVTDGLNEGITLGVDAARREGARAVLVLPADLPMVSAEALDRLLDGADAALAAGSGRPLVAIAPSDARNGTNALLLFPPDVIAPRFGEHSFEAHVRAAAAADATLQVVADHALGFDLDTPEDLEMLSPDLLRELVDGGQAVAASERRTGRPDA